MLENLFVVIFLSELIARIIADGIKYFKGAMNLLDTIIVCVNVTETWVLPFTGSECSSGGSLRMLIALRILRVLRVVRFFKLVKSFEQLWLIVSGVWEALKTVFWVLVLFGLVIYMGAVFTTTQVGRSPYFGTILESMLTLWQLASLDNWAEGIVRPAVAESPVLILFFLPFIFMTTYGLFNVILGIVVEKTIDSAQDKFERSQRDTEMERQLAIESIHTVLSVQDGGDSGMISRSEFLEIYKLDQIQSKMINILHLSIEDIIEIYNHISDANERISIPNLIGAIAQMSGSTSSFQKDLNQVLLNLDGVVNRVTAVESQVRSLENQVDSLCFKADNFSKSTLYYLTGK